MGWNSWNAYGRAVSDSLARAAADAMVSKGLIDHGWTYVNLDDGWERSAREADPLFEGPVRAPDGTMLTNKKFPDMKALGDYIHGKGLKFGIYSGPGPTTCQRLEASWQHEAAGFSHVRRLGRRLPQVRLVRLHERARAGRNEPAACRAQAAVPGRSRVARPGAARHPLFALPVRMGQRVGVGRRAGDRRQFVAHDGRHHRYVGEHGGHRVPAGRSTRSTRRRAIGTIPTCSSSARWVGVRVSATRVSRPTSSTCTSRSGRCSPRHSCSATT